MPTVTFIEHDGTVHTLQARPDRTLMQVALDHGVPGLLGDCGGACSCATCHGYVDKNWAEGLAQPSETEACMLDAVLDRQPTSRLCCQIKLSPALDGIVVRLPAEQS